jgi:hypothetical protein
MPPVKPPPVATLTGPLLVNIVELPAVAVFLNIISPPPEDETGPENVTKC